MCNRLFFTVVLGLLLIGGLSASDAISAADPALVAGSRITAAGQTQPVIKCYPHGLMRAHCVNFDDGNCEPDRRVADSLRQRGLHATFFVNSLHPQSQDALAHPEIYSGFEVASHGAHHQGFGKMDEAAARAELEPDQRTLGQLFHAPVIGFAFPYGDEPKDGDAQARLHQLFASLGIIYARKTGTTGAFRPPLDFYRWIPDCGIGTGSAGNLKRLLAQPTDTVRVMMEFTHSRDLTNGKFPWPVWEAYLDLIAHEASVWSVTCGDYASYVIALRKVVINDSGVTNPDAHTAVWIRVGERAVEILPGQSLPWAAIP